MNDTSLSRASSLVVGLLLVVAGVAFLLMQVYGIQLTFDLGRVGWPLYVIAPGIVLLLIGLFLPAAPGAGLAVGGSIVTTVGLILAYQSSTGHWSSWAYAWALVGPGAVGLGLTLWGILHLSRETLRTGLTALGAGLLLFLVGFAFFEGVLNLGGERGLAPLGRQALPVALIVAGVLVIATRLWPRPHHAWTPPPGPPPSAGSPNADPIAAPDPIPSADAATEGNRPSSARSP